MKPPESLTIGEVAAFFGWAPRLVERLAVGGKLPGLEINGQWLFKREELVDWLDQKIQTLDAARVSELEQRLEADLQTGGPAATPRSLRLSDRLRAEGIALDVPLEGKAAVLKELVALAERGGGVLDRGHLHASLIERESLCSTALPGGVAICHPRRSAPFILRNSILCFLRTRDPIPFGAEDGETTQFFFLFCELDDQSHLLGLARLVRLLRGPALDELRRAASADEVVATLRSREAEGPKPGA